MHYLVLILCNDTTLEAVSGERGAVSLLQFEIEISSSLVIHRKE